MLRPQLSRPATRVLFRTVATATRAHGKGVNRDAGETPIEANYTQIHPFYAGLRSCPATQMVPLDVLLCWLVASQRLLLN